MDRYGENIAENENDMVAVVLFVLLLWSSWIIFTYLGWSVTNYLGNETPYNLGLCLLVAGIIMLSSLHVETVIYIYLIILWVTGFIDDRFGTKYPKGLKGHFRLFIQTKKISTGLLKLVCTVGAAALFTIIFYNGLLWESLAIFLLLVLGPHVMNLFDTRPLRVWKVIGIQAIVFLPFFIQLQIDFLFAIGFMIAALIFFEAQKMAMLGDNGATLLGGMINIVAVFHLSFLLQWVFVTLYCFLIIISEKVSLSILIEKTPILKMIDRWGVT